MDFAEKQSFLNQKKYFSTDFSFFLSNVPLKMHSFLGLPLIPLFGKYARDGYTLDEIKGLILLSVKYNNISKDMEFFNAKTPFKIKFPIEVLDVLNNIPEKIPHNKPINSNNNQKNKNTYKKPEIFDFHPFKFFPLPQIKFVWSINFHNKSSEFLPKSKPNMKNPPESFKNIINHTWVFEDIDFSFKKKLINNIPCCVIIPKSISNSCGVRMYLTDNKGINFGSLRSEYLSTHVIQGSLCLSPNNMRIHIDDTNVLSHFWSVYLQPDNEHMVVYQWIFNDMEEIFQGFLKEADSLTGLLEKCAMILGDKHEAIQAIRELF